MVLSPEDVQQMKQIAELEVRRYFDYYQDEIFPKQLVTIINSHDGDDKAHGGVEIKMNRAVWVLIGVSFTSGGAGAFVAKILLILGS